jgi:peroxiredoxin
VSSIPHTVVIDKAGHIRAVYRGVSAELEPLVEQLLK